MAYESTPPPPPALHPVTAHRIIPSIYSSHDSGEKKAKIEKKIVALTFGPKADGQRITV